jgi:hypothetical protein
MERSRDGGAGPDEEDELSISTGDGVVAAFYFYAEWQIYAPHQGAAPHSGCIVCACPIGQERSARRGHGVRESDGHRLFCRLR